MTQVTGPCQGRAALPVGLAQVAADPPVAVLREHGAAERGAAPEVEQELGRALGRQREQLERALGEVVHRRRRHLLRLPTGGRRDVVFAKNV